MSGAPSLTVVFLTLSTSWQTTVDAARAEGEVAPPLARAVLALVRCAPLPRELRPEVAALFRAEGLRRQRLSTAGRAATVWGELDLLSLTSNDSGRVRWPTSTERWSDEQPLLATADRLCDANNAADQAAELGALLSAGSQRTANADYQLWRLRAAEGSWACDEPTPTFTNLADKLRPWAALLLAERAFACGTADATTAATFAQTSRDLPDAAPGALVRWAQLAAASGETGPAPGLSAAADRVRWLAQAHTLARTHDWPALRAHLGANLAALREPDNDNEPLLRQLVVQSLATAPFDDTAGTIVTALLGPGRTMREVLAVGDLARGRRQWVFADSAYRWVQERSPTVRDEATARRALVAAHSGESHLLAEQLGLLTTPSDKVCRLLVAGASVLDPKGPAGKELRAYFDRTSKLPSLSGEARGRLRTALAEPRAATVLEVDASAGVSGQAFPTPAAPTVHFAFPEPYALFDLADLIGPDGPAQAQR